MSSPLSLQAHLVELCRGPAGGPPPEGVSVRRLTPSAVDARLFFGRPAVLDGAAGRDTLGRLEADPWIADLRRKGGSVSLRLADAYVDELGALLERGAPGGLFPDAPLAGRRYAVNFLNPNATKPLHVGHLRNVALGRALAAALAAAGAGVVRQCYVCDVGRNVCEAMAGYEELRPADAPAQAGLRPDVFVGRCYAAYASSVPDAPGDEDDPAGREGRVHADRADELARAWMVHEPGARALWQRLRAWALDGQERTLARLGAGLDRCFYESDSFAGVQRFVERGVAEGVLAREPDGAVVFLTGRADYPRLPLVRADGFPTEHARVVALFLVEAAQEPLPDGWIVVCGDEWKAAGAAELEVARRLGGAALADRVDIAMHGMVTLAGSKMKSRDGRALLADEFLDELERAPELARIAARHDDALAPRELALVVAQTYFLSRRPAKPIELDAGAIADPARNPGWTLADALARATRAAEQPSAAPHDAEAYRTAVLQAHQARELVLASGRERDASNLVRFLCGLAAWSLERAGDRRLHRVVRTLFDHGLAAAGLRTEPAERGALTPRA